MIKLVMQPIRDTPAAALGKHVERVHLYVLALSFAVVLFCVAAGPPDLARALRDLENIAALSRNWRQAWQGVGDEMYARYPKRSTELPTAIRISEVGEGFDTSGTWWFVPTRWKIEGVTEDRGDVNDRLPAPTTVGAFRQAWDNLNGRTPKAHIALWMDQIMVIQGLTDRYEVKWSRDTVRDGSSVVSEQPLILPFKSRRDCSFAARSGMSELIFCSEGTFQSFAIEGQFAEAGAGDLQSGLMKRVTNNRYVAGAFEDSFAELHQLSRDFQDVDFAVLRRIMLSEARRSQRDVTVFGTAVPAQGVRLWTVAALLLLQLYFFLHVRELFVRRGLDADALSLPWMAVYPSRAARIAFAIFLGAPPTAATGAAVLTGHYQGWAQALAALALTLSATMAGATVVCYGRWALRHRWADVMSTTPDAADALSDGGTGAMSA